MNRKTSSEDLENVISKIRKNIPEVIIRTTVMVGFPDESEEDFEKLILAYDYSTRKNSKYKILEEEPEMEEQGAYKYPALKFVRRRL